MSIAPASPVGTATPTVDDIFAVNRLIAHHGLLAAVRVTGLARHTLERIRSGKQVRRANLMAARLIAAGMTPEPRP